MNPKLERIVTTIEAIPSLPQTVLHILTTIDSEDSTIDEIARTIKKDQALTVNILKIGNSAFYGNLGQVNTVRQAIVLMGLRQLKNIVLSQTVFRFYGTNSTTGFSRMDLWAHSAVTAFLSMQLCRDAFISDPDGAGVVGGLIHDIGKVVVDRYLPAEFARVVHLVQETKVSFRTAEKRVLGYTHDQIGAALLKKWHFPNQLVAPVLFHHAPWKDPDFPQISTAVFYANILSKVLNYPSFKKEPRFDTPWSEDPEKLAFLERSGLPVRKKDLKNFLRAVHNKILSAPQSVFGAIEIPQERERMHAEAASA